MKHIFKIIAMLVAVSAIWIALLETATVPRRYLGGKGIPIKESSNQRRYLLVGGWFIIISASLEPLLARVFSLVGSDIVTGAGRASRGFSFTMPKQQGVGVFLSAAAKRNE
uniref:Uncharacterized protein n=1 Tax=Oryza meridionalis TaxID=40149 RepID=A0A0E0CRJ3_9ORYZ